VTALHATSRLRASHRPGTEALRVLSASGQLGYGIPAASFERGMARWPHFVSANMGSINPGPYDLATGLMDAPGSSARRDLALVLAATLKAGVPPIIGSAATADAQSQLDRVTAPVREIAAELGHSLRLVTMASDILAEGVVQALAQGRLAAIGPMPDPTEDEILSFSHIVGQCGVETFQPTLKADPDVILVGRACDTAIFAALPALLGYPLGLALHMAKIIGCASLCCEPGGRDAMLTELTTDGFTPESRNPARQATSDSMAAQALYEQASPETVEEPGGTLHLQSARHEAVDQRRTHVSGACFAPRLRPTLKIKGATRLCARALLVAGVDDPGLIDVLDAVLQDVTVKVRSPIPGDWQLVPHVYGRGAAPRLAPAQQSAHEVGLVLEFIAPERELARTLAAVYKQNLLHHGYPARVTTAGNLAFALTPSVVDADMACRFVLHHIMADVPVDEFFKQSVHDLVNGSLS